MIDLTTKDKLLTENAKFYEAFERSDLSALEELWSHANTVKCIHPGWQLIVGWEAVRQSWQRIFESGMQLKISLRNVSAEVLAPLGIVTLIEELSYETPTGITTGAVMATNIFEFDGTNWKMIHHHGSPMIVAEQPERDETYRYN